VAELNGTEIDFDVPSDSELMGAQTQLTLQRWR